MVETLIASLAGGATGLIGSISGRVFGFFEQKQKIKEKELDYEQELKLQEMQYRQADKEMENERAIVSTKANAEMMAESYKHDSSYGSSILRWVRPVLTLALIGCTVFIYHTIDPNTKSDIAAQVVFLTGLAVSWWFADRSGKIKK